MLSNVMLRQVAWLSSVKVVLDQPETDLSRHSLPPLAEWISDHADATLVDSSTGTITELSNRITDAFERLRANRDEKSAFSELISASNEVIEVLSGNFEDDSLVWSEALSVGAPLIDQHHQRLFTLIGNLFAAMRDGAAKGSLEPIFDELLDYTVYHFDAEERAFAEFSYPQAERHIGFHQELVAKARELRADLAGRVTVPA